MTGCADLAMGVADLLASKYDARRDRQATRTLHRLAGSVPSSAPFAPPSEAGGARQRS